MNRMNETKMILSHLFTENDYSKWFTQKALKKSKVQDQALLKEGKRHNTGQQKNFVMVPKMF